MGCGGSKEDKHTAQNTARIAKLEAAHAQLEKRAQNRVQGEIAYLEAALAAFKSEEDAPEARRILESRVQVLRKQLEKPSSPKQAPSPGGDEGCTVGVPSTPAVHPAPPDSKSPAEMPMCPDHPFHTHELGVGATLRALQQRGDAEQLFRPLQTEFERVLTELDSSAYESILHQEELTVEGCQDETTKFMVIKTVDIVPGANVAELFRICHDTGLRTRWEKKWVGSEKTVHTMTDYDTYEEGMDEVFLFQYPGIMFIKGREFLDRRLTHRDARRGLYVVIQGVATNVDKPKTKKYIRAETVFQCTMWYAVPGGAAVFNLILGDPKGNLSTSMVNHQSKVHPVKWHKGLLSAYKHVASSDLKPVVGPFKPLSPQGHRRSSSEDQTAEQQESNPITIHSRSASLDDVTNSSPHLHGLSLIHI
eukprot:TRINITY_DN4365_c0_g1_i1.p1 TRINITY_DN4365_c0_g1~~TRINITY_DN4365_c0_g1_i1.p1  ORF type:complete len:420 (-),score=97.59 TRINITY_DN4365_c0_g1_i1:130-1389(-)